MSKIPLHLLSEDPSFDNNTHIPNPSCRHAVPSAPWPWLDISNGRYSPTPLPAVHQLKTTTVDPVKHDPELLPVPVLCDHINCDNTCWEGYPISSFPDWTEFQVKKSKLLTAVEYYDRHRLWMTKAGSAVRRRRLLGKMRSAGAGGSLWQMGCVRAIRKLTTEWLLCDSDPPSFGLGQSFFKICRALSYKCSEQSKSFCWKRSLLRKLLSISDQ